MNIWMHASGFGLHTPRKSATPQGLSSGNSHHSFAAHSIPAIPPQTFTSTFLPLTSTSMAAAAEAVKTTIRTTDPRRMTQSFVVGQRIFWDRRVYHASARERSEAAGSQQQEPGKGEGG